MVRGGYKYNPKEVLDELNITKVTFKLDHDADAFKKMVENAKIGRQIRFTIDFNVNRRKR